MGQTANKPNTPDPEVNVRYCYTSCSSAQCFSPQRTPVVWQVIQVQQEPCSSFRLIFCRNLLGRKSIIFIPTCWLSCSKFCFIWWRPWLDVGLPGWMWDSQVGRGTGVLRSSNCENLLSKDVFACVQYDVWSGLPAASRSSDWVTLPRNTLFSFLFAVCVTSL